MRKEWLKIIIFSIIFLCIILISIEVSLRVIALFPKDSRFFMNDSLLGYRVRPNITFSDGTLINAYGFNDINHSPEKTKNTKRIAFIGDSITFGLQRQKNFVFTFEQKAVESGIKIEALNMGIPGADPAMYLKILNNDARKMGCDTVAIIFFIGNDILQSHRDFETKVHMGEPKMLLKYPWVVGPSLEYFYTYRFLRSCIHIIRECTKHKNADGTFTKENFLNIEKRYLPVYQKTSTLFIRECYEGAQKTLKSISKQAKKDKMKLFIVLVPDEIQVNDTLRKELLSVYKIDSRDYDFALPQRIIIRYLREEGIPYLDLLPIFQVRTKKIPLYLKQDTHWNKTGHDTAAAEILAFVKDNNVI